MNTGKSITALAQEIERQAASKRDYIADTRQLSVEPVQENGPALGAHAGLRLIVPNGERLALPITTLAHRQIGERVGVPAKYYERMLAEAPELLARNVNHWLHAAPEQRMIRTLDGHARAFLSNRYQRIDNLHVAETILPILARTDGLEIVSAEVTDRRLYIKAKSTAIRAEVKGTRRVGDFVEAGIAITNSEVGLGAVSVQPFYFFLACRNGMVRNREGLRAAHIGTRHDEAGELANILADDTRRVLDQGVLLKVRDVVRSLLNQSLHQQAVDRMSAQAGERITGDPVKAIELLGNDMGISDGERSGVLRHLIDGGDLSRYGVMNAVTRAAEDAETYDRASELEILGGRVFDLPARDWQRVAVAA